MDVSERIKSCRKSANLTQVELADKSGISLMSIRRYEANKRKPNITQIEKIAAALYIKPFDLLGAEYFDIEAGSEKVNQLAEGVKLLDVVQEQHGQQTADTLGLLVELNPTGQEKAFDYISDLHDNPKYKK
jgi:transcriptional regulator with XRE-family HTH domain